MTTRTKCKRVLPGIELMYFVTINLGCLEFAGSLQHLKTRNDVCLVICSEAGRFDNRSIRTG